MLATLTWYVTRASGVVAYALLSASVIFGLLMSGRLHGRRPSRPWMLDVHRMLGGLAVLLVGVHLTALLLDGFVHFDLFGVLVPFASSWNPAAVAAGVVALWMLAAVEITSLLRDRIPNRTWRRIHLLSFGAFLLASVHFVAAGTDAASPVVIVSLLAVVATVVGLTVLRVAQMSSSTPPRVPAPPARTPVAGRATSVPPPPRRRRELVGTP
jgi:methionine sulfoxide reductase heme-binding subunit